MLLDPGDSVGDLSVRRNPGGRQAWVCIVGANNRPNVSHGIHPNPSHEPICCAWVVFRLIETDKFLPAPTVHMLLCGLRGRVPAGPEIYGKLSSILGEIIPIISNRSDRGVFNIVKSKQSRHMLCPSTLFPPTTRKLILSGKKGNILFLSCALRPCSFY